MKLPNKCCLLPLSVPKLQGVLRHCLHGESVKTPAMEKSARTSTCLKITRGHIRSTHIYLRMRKEAQSSIFLQQCLVTQSHAASHFLSLTRLEVIFIFFTTRKRAVRHFIHFSQKSSEPKQFISTVAQLRPEKPSCTYQVSAAPWLLCNARSFSHCFHLVAIFWKTKMHIYLPSFTNTGTKNSSTKWI